MLTLLSINAGVHAVGKLYVADTNNSLIRVLDLRAQGGPKLETLELKGVLPPTLATPSGPRRLRQRLSSDTQVIRIDPVTALNGDLQLQISLASGYHFSKVSSTSVHGSHSFRSLYTLAGSKWPFLHLHSNLSNDALCNCAFL